MANTVDTLGEQKTLDGLVAHSLEDFEDSRITEINQFKFFRNQTLKSVNLPNATKIGNRTFDSCYNLESVIIPKIDALVGSLFIDCYKLKAIDTSGSNKIGDGVFYECYSLNDVDLSNITTIGAESFKESGVGTFILPKCTRTSYGSFFGLRVSTIDFFELPAISSDSFIDTYSLAHLIIRTNTVCSNQRSGAFNNSLIKEGLGWIYVPSNLVDSYKSASNWSTYADRIVSLDEYPKALSGETITDSWDEIFQAENDGSYKTKYSVGDTKYLVIGGTYVLMQIIAFDRDILSSDHTSTAKITWLSKSLSFEFLINFTNTTTGGWADCECRKFLSDTIYEQIPENVRNKIVAVDKTYTATSLSSSTATVSDKLWIPSAREICGGSSYENTGIDYTDFFTDSSVRKKHNGLLTNSASNWWLRSIYGFSTFYVIYNNGDIYNNDVSTNNKIALGFCT